MTTYAEPEFVTLPELAERLRLKPRTVRRWVAYNKIPAYRFGNRLRFRLSEVLSAAAVGREEKPWQGRE